MDSFNSFLVSIISKHYPEKLAERFKQMKIEEEAPVLLSWI